MTATYPTTAKIYAAKQPGETIASATINSLQEEITAMEAQLIAGGVHIATAAPTANAVPKADAAGKLAVGWMPAGQTFVPLTTPLTSTAWDGDTKTTVERGVLDLSVLFGAPAGIKAIAVRISATSAIAGATARLGLSSSNLSAVVVVTAVANQVAEAAGIVPCDANGDIYYTNATGYSAATTIEIWGYWL